LNQNGPRSGPR
jgi:archaellum component FlaD/FlaE